MFNFFTKKRQLESNSEPVNIQAISEDFNDFEPVATFFKATTGITFDQQQSILKSKLICFCKMHQIHSFKQCLEQVKIDQGLKQQLINYLTTNESYFYREYHHIEDVVNKIKINNHPVSILCAPCSTGEEIYTITIALLDAGVTKSRFNITGIDINSEALKYAELGIYNQRSVNKIPSQLLQTYFSKSGSKYHLSNKIKQCVRLRKENIFSPEFKKMGKFDYIFSRNMLIYFDKDTKIKARQILEGLLKNHHNPIYFGHADLF